MELDLDLNFLLTTVVFVGKVAIEQGVPVPVCVQGLCQLLDDQWAQLIQMGVER